MTSLSVATYPALFRQVKAALLDGQRRIEAERVYTYWETGRLIQEHLLLNQDRADYGTKLFVRLGEDLDIDPSLLRRCVQFAETYPQIRAARREFNWNHYKNLITIADKKERARFEDLTEKNGWSSKELAQRIKAERGETSNEEGKALDVRRTTSESERPTSNVQCLTPLKGQLYTYQIIKPKFVANDSTLAVDLGFSICYDTDLRQLASFSAGDIVESLAKDDGYRFSKTGRTAKDLFTYQAWVERVVDGDTLKVKIDLGFAMSLRTTLRLRGIDCPEVGTKEGEAAKIYVQSLIKEADRIVIRSSRDDKYGRYLADVFVSGVEGGEEVFLNGLLLEKNLAEIWEE